MEELGAFLDRMKKRMTWRQRLRMRLPWVRWKVRRDLRNATVTTLYLHSPTDEKL